MHFDPPSGRTALMWASIHGHPAAVRLLLDHGADLTRKERSGGHTALTLAAETASVTGLGGSADCFLELQAAGADLHTTYDKLAFFFLIAHILKEIEMQAHFMFR